MGKFYPSWSLFFDNRFETTGHGLLHDPLIQNLAMCSRIGIFIRDAKRHAECGPIPVQQSTHWKIPGQRLL